MQASAVPYAVPKPGPSTRAQIVGVASDLIKTRSYLGFSFQDVADAVGIRKASLYHHFATKEALGIEVVRHSLEGFKTWSARLGGKAPKDALDSYFRMYRNDLHAGAGVCPTGAMAPGWDCIGDEVRQAVRELRQEQVLWLTGVLGAWPRPKGKAAPAAGALAGFVFAVCQGALLSARMTGRVADFDEAVAQLKASLPG
jgi:TetR/AcrR family transcriptional repressor of nem operon